MLTDLVSHEIFLVTFWLVFYFKHTTQHLAVFQLCKDLVSKVLNYVYFTTIFKKAYFNKTLCNKLVFTVIMAYWRTNEEFCTWSW